MSEPLVDNPPSRRAPAGRRIGLALELARERDVYLALLAAAGLPVNAGALPLARIDELASDPPDAVVLVAEALRHGVLAALRRLQRAAPSTHIVVVVTDEEAAGPGARQALNAGADAFVPGTLVEDGLAAAVHAVLAGLVCAPRETRRALAKPTFSHREKEVLALLVAGLTNREIAARLFVAESTVKSHLMTAFAKLGVGSRKDAVSRLLDPEEGLALIALPPGPAHD